MSYQDSIAIFITTTYDGLERDRDWGGPSTGLERSLHALWRSARLAIVSVNCCIWAQYHEELWGVLGRR